MVNNHRMCCSHNLCPKQPSSIVRAAKLLNMKWWIIAAGVVAMTATLGVRTSMPWAARWEPTASNTLMTAWLLYFPGRCSHASRTKQPSSNLEGRTTAIYGKHIADGMVNVHRRRCLHSSCTKPSTFNVEGRKTVAFCRHYELWTAWWTLRKGLLKQLLP